MKQILPALLIGTALLGVQQARTVHAQAASTPKVYELRIYTATAGRLADLESLIGNQGLRTFAKHGIQNVFDGTVLEGAPIDGADASNMLVCIVAHKDRANAEKDWTDFEADRIWKNALAKAETNGPLLSKPPVSLLLDTTDFSPALESPTPASSPTRIFELRKYNTGPERLQTTVDEFQQGLGAILVDVGMKPVIYWTADNRSSFVYLIAHKDRETARASWTAFGPKFRPFITTFNARQASTTAPPSDSNTPPRRRTPDDNRFLVPTAFSPIR